MEALVAATSHTGNQMYLDFMGQLMHHQLEANRRLSDLTRRPGLRLRPLQYVHAEVQGGQRRADGGRQTFSSSILEGMGAGVRAPHSSAVLLPGTDEKSVRVFHLSGRGEEVSLIVADGRKVTAVTETENDGGAVGPVEFKN